MNWQFEFLKYLSSNFEAAKKGISNIPLDVSFDIKRQHISFSLKKFYRPTINNLSDVANQLLWLADPSTFNDPQDCQLGIDSNFQVFCLDKFVEKCDIFSSNEKSQIWNAKRKNKSIYSYDIFPILQLDNRIKLFEDFYHNLTNKVDEYICTLKKTQYRIACFVQDFGNPYEYDNLMWAHYAQDFQGFCVEYDVEQIFDYVFEDYFVFDWNSKTDYLHGRVGKEMLKQIIINGLFPVVYSSKPLSCRGQLVENFWIRFQDGKAVEVHAEKNETALKQLISTDDGAAYLGECAFVPYDSPISQSKIMFYNTLFDENAACHLALGRGFVNSVRNYEKYSLEECRNMGVNDSIIHEDFMIGTEDMSITGFDNNGNEFPIFENGNWAFSV